MNLQKTIRSIQPLDKTAMEQAARRWDSIAKPLHSLGLLEETIIRAAGMQRTSRVSFLPGHCWFFVRITVWLLKE